MKVKLRESKRLGSRHHEKRRGRRMNSRVPVRLEWDDEAGKRINAAIIVWKGSQRPDGWEYGVELVTPEMDFWGLDL